MATSPKEIIFEEEAREGLFNGIKKLAEVVGVTIGPRGRNVGLEKSWGAPTITNDGSSIVKDISFKNPYEDMGASMLKEAIQKIKEKCGDGTTTCTLLIRSLVELSLKNISAGASPIGIKRGMEKAIDAIIKEIDKIAIPVKDNSEIKNIATVSASGNHEIGSIISEAMERVGRSGVITIEEAKGTETVIDQEEGMSFDRGYISPYFCTNMDRMIVEMHNPSILIVDKKISTVHEILPILQAIATSSKELLIIAEELDGDALSTLVVNKLRGTLKVAAVKSPGFGDRRKAMLQDIAVLTGASVISEEAGINLAEVQPDVLGSCDKVEITKDHTIIIGGKGSQEAIAARIKQIEIEAADTKSSYDKEKLEERKAKLSGGVAVIRVGAATEPELKQKKQMFEDSLNSTKAAMEQGIVPGGGLALVKASRVVDSLNLEGDEAIGARIVKTACETPLKQIVNNAGFDGSVVLADILKRSGNFGFNAATGNVEDLMSAGVIDPAKVVKSALIYAGSTGGIFAITECCITDAKEEEEAK